MPRGTDSHLFLERRPEQLPAKLQAWPEPKVEE